MQSLTGVRRKGTPKIAERLHKQFVHMLCTVHVSMNGSIRRVGTRVCGITIEWMCQDQILSHQLGRKERRAFFRLLFVFILLRKVISQFICFSFASYYSRLKCAKIFLKRWGLILPIFSHFFCQPATNEMLMRQFETNAVIKIHYAQLEQGKRDLKWDWVSSGLNIQIDIIIRVGR